MARRPTQCDWINWRARFSGVVLGGWWLPVVAAITGALGAVVSAIQRLAQNPTDPIPAQLGSFTATLTRPLIGAVAALTTYLASVAGLILDQEQHWSALLVLAAFAASFSERLVVYHPDKSSSDKTP